MSNPLDDLTVCITSFHRVFHLDRAIGSCLKAGIRRIAIAAIEPSSEVLGVIEKHRADGWISYDVSRVDVDLGCNNTWALACYFAKTDRVIVLHDDDILNPEFGPTYCQKIAPMLDSGIGFACWRANHIFDDGTTHKTEWWTGPSRIDHTKTLENFVGRFHALSLSPIVSVLHREIIIHACKEAEETLTHNECIERPGMLYGTEILVYLRHCKAFARWFYVDELLSMYGAHDGSGTIAAEKKGDLNPLFKGYDRARVQGIMRRAPTPKPKLILLHYYAGTPSEDEARRNANAAFSRKFLAGTFEAIDVPLTLSDLPRNSSDLGDANPIGYIRDILDLGCEMAMPEDIIVFANEDIGLTTETPARLIAGIDRGRGVTCCPRRVLNKPTPGRFYRTVKNCKTDGGMDVLAVTKSWWALFREQLPDMLIGREAWDLCFRTLAEEWADGSLLRSTITVNPEEWWRSRAYTDDVAWHEPHPSLWKVDRATNVGGAHNRKLARDFFTTRSNIQGLSCVQEPVPNVAPKSEVSP
jgi:hypothetical protein